MFRTTAFALLALAVPALAVPVPAPEKRTVSIQLTVPSSAYGVSIKAVYQTEKELWVLSEVRGGGIGLQVISKVKAKQTVNAPDLPIKHFVVGKRWNWTAEKQYTYLANKAAFEKKVKEAKAKKLFVAKEVKPVKPKTSRYIVSFKKELFKGGKNAAGQTLEEAAKAQAKKYNGKFGRMLGIINGYTVELSPANAKKLAKDPSVKFIEEDRPVGIGPGIRN